MSDIDLRRRADLYERLARAEERVAELEAEIDWHRIHHDRESDRAAAALAAASEALDALSAHRSEHAHAIEELVTRVRTRLPATTAMVAADGEPLDRLRQVVDALIEAAPGSTPARPEPQAAPVPASTEPGESSVPGRRLRAAMAESDELVAAAHAEAQARLGGTETLGPFIPRVPVPPGPITRPDLRVACVIDEFSELAFRYEFDHVRLSLEGWRRQLEERLPDALLVESAWRGNGGEWRYRVSRPSEAHDDLVELVDWCRKRGVPTVFWNKEDPANFDLFKASARLFDHVFTTDADCIPRYLELLGHDRVHALPFAAQPRIHNPIRVPGARTRPVAFAGTYYAEKHPNRKVQMEAVVDPAREFGLEIFSRVTDDPRYSFPEKYQPHIVGSVSYPDVLTAHKLYRVFLNVNSVVGSSTMCARRIFELLASATGVVSGVSPAIQAQVGAGLVRESTSPEETAEALRLLLGDEEARLRTAVRGLRTIMSGHTYGDRVEAIRRAVGLDRGELAPPRVTAVALAGDADQAWSVIAALRRQSFAPAEVVLALRGVDPSEVALAANDLRVRVVEAPGSEPSGASLRRGLGLAAGTHVALFDPKAFYGPDYLGDAMSAFRYADTAFVGKRVGSPELEYSEVGWLEEGSVTFAREALDVAVPPEVEEGAVTLFLLDCRRAGLKLFATDRFNFVPDGPAPGDCELDRAVV